MFRLPLTIHLKHNRLAILTSWKGTAETKTLNRLFIKPGIQERGTECGECAERRIPGNVIILTFRECWRRFRGMFEKIPGNVRRDSGECSKRFCWMFEKIPVNVRRDFGECSRRFRGMLVKIPGNVGKDSRECSKRLKAL